MPKNEDQNLSVGAQSPAETDRERFERERLSRRQALKRFGMTSAMATFALFSVDDLARMVGKAMQQRAGDNKVAAQIAQEFQQAGIALAAGPSGSSGCSGCDSICTEDDNWACDSCDGCNQFSGNNGKRRRSKKKCCQQCIAEDKAAGDKILADEKVCADNARAAGGDVGAAIQACGDAAKAKLDALAKISAACVKPGACNPYC